MFRVCWLASMTLVGGSPVGMLRAQDVDYRIPVAGSKHLYWKVIVTSETVQFHGGKEAPSKDPKGTVGPFAIYHRLFVDDKKQERVLKQGADTFVRVGNLSGTPVGWLKVRKLPPTNPTTGEPQFDQSGGFDADFIDWGTRFVLSPKPAYKDPQSQREHALRVFSDEIRSDDKWLCEFTRFASGHVGETHVLKQLGAAPNWHYKVICYTAKAERGGRSQLAFPKDALDVKETELEVVFVIDTTRSMTNLLQGTKEVVKQCIAELKELPQLKGAVRFGLVEYQDNTDIPLLGKLTPSRLVNPLTADLPAFDRAINDLKVATIPSEETKEDVLAGLHRAISEGGWGKNSTKHIVLLGDASAHLEGPKNSKNLTIQQVLKMGRQQSGGSAIEQELSRITFSAGLLQKR
jgi:hypothetical protein